MSEPSVKAKMVSIRDDPAHGVLERLEELQDIFMAGLQSVRAIKANIQKRSDQKMTLERLLSAKEVAEILGETERWVYGQAREKKMPSLKLGKCWKFSPSALQKWIEEQTP